ncbi:MAG: VanW family protein, partial [Candidatus Limnocylindrales bacterium]
MTSRVDEVQFGTSGMPGFAWRRLAFWFVLTLLAIVAFGAAFAFAYDRMHERTLLPGVQVAGVDLAGLDRQAAERRLRATLPDLSGGALTVRVGSLEESIPYAEFERDYDFEYMLEQAFTLGRAGNLIDQLREQVAILQHGASIDPVMTWNTEELASRVAALANAAQVEVVDARITRQNGRYLASPASAGASVDVQDVVGRAMAAVNNVSPADADVAVEPTTIVPAVSTEAAEAAAGKAERVVATALTMAGADLSTSIDPAVLSGWVHLAEVGVGEWHLSIESGPIADYVANYGRQADTPPTNATFAIRGGNIDVVPSAVGRAVDVVPSAASVLAALQARADGRADVVPALSLVPVAPALSTEEARAIAPRVTKLAEWTTFYVPGPLNGEGVNIEIPTSILDGVVVEPGAEFDFLTGIGPVTSPPYVTGGALVHGQIEEDGAIGGGMCSTSTTLFNAGLRYGLPVTARDNHSLYISRYPMGLDATVWMTGPRNRQTMAFTNDTGYPLVVRGINNLGAVTFEVWGVDDGRTVELSEPRIENVVKVPYMLVEYTDELAPGRRVRVNDAYDAFDAWVTRT